MCTKKLGYRVAQYGQYDTDPECRGINENQILRTLQLIDLYIRGYLPTCFRCFAFGK